MKVKCRKFDIHYEEYLIDTLNHKYSKEIEIHLENCRRCKKIFSRDKSLLKAVGNFEQDEFTTPNDLLVDTKTKIISLSNESKEKKRFLEKPDCYKFKIKIFLMILIICTVFYQIFVISEKKNIGIDNNKKLITPYSSIWYSLTDQSGEILIKRKELSKWKIANRPTTGICIGDQLKTGKNTTGVISTSTDIKLNLKQNTNLAIEEKFIILRNGALQINTKNKKAEEEFVIKTPYISIISKKSIYKVSHSDVSGSLISVIDGSVTISSSKDNKIVTGGYTGIIKSKDSEISIKSQL